MFEPGTQVGRYEIQRRLGRGGMGAVYVAHDPVLGRMVAIKVFAGDLDLPDARERFSREARAAAALSHPNIVTVYDFGEYESQPFIVMEYVAGETLAGFIRRKTPVTLADKVRWMEELCAGAGYAHQMQLVHRDIKPANLMIDRSGRLKILDFGIARMLGLASNTAVMIGTPGYMAPEQITGDPVDHRADQFSIGVVFYELLAGTEAFPGDTLPMITHRILNEDPVPLGRLAPDAPPELISIIQQTLKKKPADRFADTETLRSVIARVRRDTSSQGWNVNTVAVGRETPPPTSRGTGSARRRQDEAVGVAQLTPPPDPKRTDREVIAKRRTMQLEAALQEARKLLAQGQLESALDACQQALTFDENHVGALRLEEEIETALRRQTKAQPGTATAVPSANVETLWADLDARPSEVITRLDQVAPMGIPPAPSGGVDRTVVRLPTASPADATVIAPPRRTPPPVPAAVAPAAPAQPAAAPPVAQPPASQPVAKAPVQKESSAPAAKKAPSIGPMVADIVARCKTIVAAAGSVAAAVPRDRRTLSIVGGVIAVIVATVVGFTMFSGPVPTGTVVIDATPWGTITAIETESGTAVSLPSSASTPLVLTLPAGTYQVVVAGPAPESQTQRITVQVAANGSAVAPLVHFRELTAEEYFEQYLSAPTALTPESGVVPTEPGAPPSLAQPSPVPAPAAPIQSLPASAPAPVSNP
ncbi:MAG TPA: serine/threonine-protein kinase [Vicinamibacterales bacterium]|nr:serine/threonine-protein kinase [Vicinamibacterales bacterium]